LLIEHKIEEEKIQMSDFVIHIDEQEELDFDLNIETEGTIDPSELEVRFTINEARSKISFPAKKNGKVFTVEFDKLNKLSPGRRECMIEVIYNERYNIAWQDEVDFEKSIKIEAAVKTPKRKKTSITVGRVGLSEKKIIEPKIVNKAQKKRTSQGIFEADKGGPLFSEDKTKPLQKKKKIIERKRVPQKKLKDLI
jgi:hypothetical protein